MSGSGVSFDDFLTSLASEIEDVFDTVDLVPHENLGLTLFVHNDNASAVAGVRPEAAGVANVIRIRSMVINEIAFEASGEALVEVNELNRSSHIGRWFYLPDPGFIVFEADQVVMADQEYDQEELAVFRSLLMTSYATIDQIDDELLARIGSGSLAKEPLPPDWGPRKPA